MSPFIHTRLYVFIIFLFISNSVLAIPITWEFTAVASTTANRTENIFFPGDTWYGMYIFDDATLGERGAITGRTNYRNAISEISIWNDNTSITFDVAGKAGITIDNNIYGTRDQYLMGVGNTQATVTRNGELVSTGIYSDFSLFLYDFDAIMFDSNELLQEPPDLLYAETRGLFVELDIDGRGITSGFLITSIERSIEVPEPSILAMLFIGLLLIILPNQSLNLTGAKNAPPS